jgi:aspartyl protease family protein
MTNDPGPWGREQPPPPPQRPRLPGLGPWLGLVGALALLVAALAHAFPEAVRTRSDWASVGYSVGLVILITAGVARSRLTLGGRHLRYAAIWALIIAGLAFGFAYRDELAGVPRHLALAFSDGAPVVTAEHELVVPQDAQGGFQVVGKVNGQRVRFLVDTGASDTVLSPDDAKRIGVDLGQLRFVEAAETANGKAFGAAYMAERLEIGPIAFDKMRLMVNRAPMSNSLLGLSFLNRLESFQVKDGNLILRWRDPAAG